MDLDTDHSLAMTDTISELVSTYRTDVWDYAFSYVRKPDVADDITQEVFLRVYQKISTFRGQSSIKTWLLTITRNIVTDYRRSAFFRRITLVDQLFDIRKHPSAENEGIENIVMEDVWKIVLRLPTKLREVLLLQARHELSIAEISALLGITEASVKSRLHRARNKATILLAEEGDYSEKVHV